MKHFGIAVGPAPLTRTNDAPAADLPAIAGLALRLLIADLPVSRLGMVNAAAQTRAAADSMGRLRIRANSPRQPAGRLSGGNRQELAIAKWLFRESRVFLFDEPARGIDVGARIEVFALVDELARGGAGVPLVSSGMASCPGRATQEEIVQQAIIGAVIIPAVTLYEVRKRRAPL